MKLTKLALLAVSALLPGCALFENPGPVAAVSDMAFKTPWQVSPATALTAQVHRDEPQLVEIEGWGRVKATKRVLATFPYQLQSKPGRNRTVKACGEQLQNAALVHGQARVETASMGRERRMRDGLYQGTVEVRITYSRQGMHEIRQATMACTTRRDGSLVDAKALFPINDETTG